MNDTLRIASLLPSTTEIVCALGLESNLVGVTHECDFPESVKDLPKLTASKISHETMTSREIDEAVRGELLGQRHEGHASIYSLDEKLLHELKPDIILTQELCDVCAVSYKTVNRAARMFETDVKVVSLEPVCIRDILENVRTVGALTGKEQAAEIVINDLSIRIDNLAAKLADAKRPRTLMLEWLEPPFAPGHWTPEQVVLAGGACGLGQAGEPSRETTADEINAYAPEVIVLTPCGYYIEDIFRALSSAKLPKGWSELPAVVNNQVWAVDASAYFSRPSVRVVDGAEILARILHPEIFGAPSATEAVRVERELMREA